MRQNTNHISLNGLLGKVLEKQTETPLIQAPNITITPSLGDKPDKLTKEETTALFERLKHPGSIDRNVT